MLQLLKNELVPKNYCMMWLNKKINNRPAPFIEKNTLNINLDYRYMELCQILNQRIRILSCSCKSIICLRQFCINQLEKGPVSHNFEIACRIVDHGCVQVGEKVLEGGSGKGVLSLVLSQRVGSQGTVHSVEFVAKHHRLAAENFQKWNSAVCRKEDRNIHYMYGDLTNLKPLEQYMEPEYDRILLDVPSLSDAVAACCHRLKTGGTLTISSPNVLRILDILIKIQKDSLPLILEKCYEENPELYKLHRQQQDEVTRLKLAYKIEQAEERAYIGVFRKLSYLPHQLARGLIEQHNPLKRKLTNNQLQCLSSLLKEPKKNEFSFSRRGRELRVDDIVVQRMAWTAKDGPNLSRLANLQHGKRLDYKWGKVEHKDIIGKTSGQLEETVFQTEIYWHHASIQEFVDLKMSKTRLSQKNLSTFISALDLSESASVLIAGSAFHWMPLLLLNSVHRGTVFQERCKDSRYDSLSMLSDFEVWRSKVNAKTQLEHFDDIMNLRDQSVDGISYHGKLNAAILSVFWRKLKKDGILVVAAYSLHAADDCLNSVSSQLFAVVSVRESRSVEWIIRRQKWGQIVRFLDSVMKQDNLNICRQKNGGRNDLVFILKFKRKQD